MEGDVVDEGDDRGQFLADRSLYLRAPTNLDALDPLEPRAVEFEKAGGQVDLRWVDPGDLWRVTRGALRWTLS